MRGGKEASRSDQGMRRQKEYLEKLLDWPWSKEAPSANTLAEGINGNLLCRA